MDELSFDLLIPKLILQRYVNLLLEHRRVILSGSTGTGKTYLAHRLAEFIVERLELFCSTNLVVLLELSVCVCLCPDNKCYIE